MRNCACAKNIVSAHLLILCCILGPVIISINCVIALACTSSLGLAPAAGAGTLATFIIAICTCSKS